MFTSNVLSSMIADAISRLDTPLTEKDFAEFDSQVSKTEQREMQPEVGLHLLTIYERNLSQAPDTRRQLYSLRCPIAKRARNLLNLESQI
ncbi:hypothetical protein Mapa_006529 [Marchantia paleacea]|nr:hypothetical protein Mapa_006529 [Marchantia paleacea]